MRAKLARVLLSVVVGLAVATAAAAQDPATSITDIRQESTDSSTRLIVECTGPLAYTYYAPDPLTLVVDLPEVDASQVPSRIDVGTPEVESVRVTAMARGDGRTLARLEVRLSSLAPYQIFSKDRRLNLIFERPAEVADAPRAPAPPALEPAVVEQTDASSEPADAQASEAPEAPQPVPAAPPAPVSAPDLGSAVPASRILGVTPSGSGKNVSIAVRADGRLDYQDFFLGNPDRLVIDFAGVTSPAARTVPVDEGPVQRVRMAQFSAADPKVARLVLDLADRAPYQIVEGRDGVKVVFGDGGEAPRPAALAAMRPPVEPAPAPPAAALPAPAPVVPRVAAPAPVPILPEVQDANPLADEAVSAAGGQYTGHPISLDFKDGDLVDIFRLFADISGLNVVINPGVSGKVSLKLTEVPWDQALDLILKTNGLGMTIDNNVIRIARLAELQKEETDRRKLQEEKELAGDLVVWRKTLAYAKAGALQPTVQKVALSARGQITLDERTNTMIITDLPVFLDKARELIADLDRPTPQVEIEARIVVTTRSFTRDIGIQWGFNQEMSARYANTTSLSFPHSIVLNGGAVPGGGLPADQGGAATSAGIGSEGRGYAVNLPASGFNSALGISMGNILGNFNLDAALTALERQGRGRLLSTPKVTTQNNMAAEIKQGVQIPIQTVANNTVTVSFRDAVLTLKVTPQITDAGTVILEVDVQNNAADFANLVNGIPPITTQSAKTNVLVRDGATAVIGGIYQSSEQTSVNRTPLLGRIPILGYLFRNKFATNTNNELLIFITPRIIKG